MSDSEGSRFDTISKAADAIHKVAVRQNPLERSYSDLARVAVDVTVVEVVAWLRENGDPHLAGGYHDAAADIEREFSDRVEA